MNAIQSIKTCLDSVLDVRRQIGADLKRVFLITRTWSGDQIGSGDVTEESVEFDPIPGVKDYSHNIKLEAGGNIKQGDLIIHQISKNQCPLESDVDGSSTDQNIEKLYKVGEHYYRVISVVEKHLTWNVQVRRLSDQTRRDNG